MVNTYIDGNLMFYRFAYKFSYKYKDRPEKYLTNQNDIDELMKGFYSGFIHYLNHPVISKSSTITFITDQGDSWRHSLDIDYKGNRKHKDKPFDQNILIDCINRFINRLNELGFQTLSADKLEADDIIFGLTDSDRQNGRNSIIISNDSDLHQLIRVDNSSWCVVMKSDGEFVSDKKLPRSTNVDDFFNLDMRETAIINSINSIVKLIDPKLDIMVKILSGDKTDNIPSCYYRGAKNISYTKSRATNMLNESMDKLSLSDPAKIAKYVFASCNGKDSHSKDTIKIEENIKLNMKAILLRKESYPNYVLNDLIKCISGWKPHKIPDKKYLKHFINIGSSTKEDVF